ncbi:hypothetical protein [Streptomyces sp. NPDC047141]|uniref:hypothetical protein n=1 Tax=unclassified Streptomyces TaxID=2593676 RepID=UPI0034009E06
MAPGLSASATPGRAVVAPALGFGDWAVGTVVEGAPTGVDPATLSGARLPAADGTLLATARFGGADTAPVR